MSSLHRNHGIVFPQPQHLNWGEGWITLNAPEQLFRLVVPESPHPLEVQAATRIQSALPGIISKGGSAAGTIELSTAGDQRIDALPLHPEAYRLTAEDNRICLTGRGPAGVLYAAETFLQLLSHEGDRILFPRTSIDDWPDLRHRGLYVESKWGPDLMTLDNWRELIDLMAGWKFNQLDVGIYGCWGLQYPGEMIEWMMLPFPNYPKLRTPKEIEYYSPNAGEHVRATYLPAMFEDDFFGELVAYGKARNVIVRPHFNGPGHNSLIPREYPDVSAKDEWGNPTGYGYCLTNEATYTLLFDLYDSVIERYLRPHGVTWWNMGMDEVYPLLGIVLEEGRRPVDPWCECENCRQTSRQDLLLDFAFRCLRHLRQAGIDNISVWQDSLERMGITERFGERLKAEGLKDNVIVQWWWYNDPLPVPRADVSRFWVVPMAGYYHWMFHSSYLFNIAPFLEVGYEQGAEGTEAYCTFDYVNQRNYLALSEWAWNRTASGHIYEFEAKYARWLFPNDVERGAEALYKFHQVFGSAPARAMLDNLIYYWFSYPARRIDFPRDVFQRLLDDCTRTFVAIQSCVRPLEVALRLFEDLRENAVDQRVVDQLIFECRRVLGVIGTYSHGLQAIREYQTAPGQALQSAQLALDGMTSLLAEYERVKPHYLQPQGMRDLTYIYDFILALRDEIAAAEEHGAPLSATLSVLAG